MQDLVYFSLVLMLANQVNRLYDELIIVYEKSTASLYDSLSHTHSLTYSPNFSAIDTD